MHLRHIRTNFGIDQDTSKLIILVPLLNPKFAYERAAICARTSGSRHQRCVNLTLPQRTSTNSTPPSGNPPNYEVHGLAPQICEAPFDAGIEEMAWKSAAALGAANDKLIALLPQGRMSGDGRGQDGA